jgi:hypothetical protein
MWRANFYVIVRYMISQEDRSPERVFQLESGGPPSVQGGIQGSYVLVSTRRDQRIMQLAEELVEVTSVEGAQPCKLAQLAR